MPDREISIFRNKILYHIEWKMSYSKIEAIEIEIEVDNETDNSIIENSNSK